MARATVDVGMDLLAGLEAPAFRGDRQHLVTAEAHDVLDGRQTTAARALDRPGVGHLTATGRVERRFDELYEQPPVVLGHRTDCGVSISRLVADEVGLEVGAAGELERPFAESLAPARGAGAG